MTKMACVYDVMFNGEVVYVGMTSNPRKRAKEHRASGIISRGEKLVVFKWFKTRKEAYTEEASRLKDLMPWYNSFNRRCLSRYISECVYSANSTQIAAKFDVSPQTIYRRVKKLEAEQAAEANKADNEDNAGEG